MKKEFPAEILKQVKKTIYVIKDNFFKFWFRYEFTNNSYYAMLGATEASAEIMKDISNLMGDVFEDICKEYIIRLAKERKLPFIPFHLGKWWGTNPAIKEQDDVDLLTIDRTAKRQSLLSASSHHSQCLKALAFPLCNVKATFAFVTITGR